MKKNIARTFQSLLLVFLLSVSSYAQNKLEQLETVEEEIANLLLQQTGDEYFVSAYNKNFNPNLDFGFENPGNIFERGFLFTTWGPINKDSFDRYAFVGIFENGVIKWQSEKEILLSTAIDAEVLGIIDLNNDGEVEIITQWEYGMRGGNTDLWIYSWNGASGERVNAINERGSSVIQIKDYSIELVDFEPDGVLEIIGLDRSEEAATYSWNGQYYIKSNKQKPEPLPRNALNAEVSVVVKLLKDKYEYSYSVLNTGDSRQSIEAFAVRNISKKPEDVGKPENWRFNPHVKYRLVSWQVDLFLEQHPDALLEPGESDSSFSFTSTGLPRPATYYVKGNNGDLSFDTDDLVNNSVSETTLGPYNPPDPFDAGAFTDSLRSYTAQACELKWITNKGICRSLEVKLENVDRQLERGNANTAANNLQAFLNEVEALKEKQISSEAYALLHYNGTYLKEKLESRQ